MVNNITGWSVASFLLIFLESRTNIYFFLYLKSILISFVNKSCTDNPYSRTSMLHDNSYKTTSLHNQPSSHAIHHIQIYHQRRRIPFRKICVNYWSNWHHCLKKMNPLWNITAWKWDICDNIKLVLSVQTTYLVLWMAAVLFKIPTIPLVFRWFSGFLHEPYCTGRLFHVWWHVVILIPNLDCCGFRYEKYCHICLTEER